MYDGSVLWTIFSQLFPKVEGEFSCQPRLKWPSYYNIHESGFFVAPPTPQKNTSLITKCLDSENPIKTEKYTVVAYCLV